MTDNNQQAPAADATEQDQVEQPLIEIIIQPHLVTANCAPLHHFKIWPDGRIEGFEGMGARAVVLNRVPMLLATIAHPMSEFVGSVFAEIARLNEASHGVGGIELPQSSSKILVPH